MRTLQMLLVSLLFLGGVAYAQGDSGYNCQAGQGVGPTTVSGSSWCAWCVSAWVDGLNDGKQWTSYNLNPYYNAGDCTTTGTWQFKAHIAGYSGAGCSNSTFYPQIAAHGTNWTAYDQSSYPPAELGETSTGIHNHNCGKPGSGITCTYYTPWIFAGGASGFSHLSSAEDDAERDQINYPGPLDAFPNEDAASGYKYELAYVSTSDPQTNVGCGANVATDGVSVHYTNGLNGNSNWLPLEYNWTTNTVDAPFSINCISYYGDSTVGSGIWSVATAEDSTGALPVTLSGIIQSWPTGMNQFQPLLEGDLFLSHSGGNKFGTGWPACTIEYDMKADRN